MRADSSELDRIYISVNEHYSVACFIGHYIRSRDLRSDGDVHTRILEALELYPVTPPVMLNELGAWLDRHLGFRAKHP